MRPRIAPLLALLSFAALSGCGRAAPEGGAAPAGAGSPGAQAGSGGGFKIALVLPGTTNDNGWNANAYRAFLAVRKELGLSEEDSPYVENASTPGEREKNLRAYASKKFNVIIGHGNEFETLALGMEKEYPNTLFVVSSGRKAGANTQPVIYRLEDGAYLQGMLAAGVTKTGKLASVGAQPIPPLKSIFAAFEAGAKAVKPGVTVAAPVYTGEWDNVGKASQATGPLLDQGADVIMQNVDAAAVGVFNAVQERAKGGKTVYALGTNSNQNDAAPDVVIASAPLNFDKAWVEIIKSVRAGNYTPNEKVYGLAEGVVDFIINPQLEGRIPADLRARLDETKRKIQSGDFKVPATG